MFEVEGDVAQLLLDITNDFTLSGGGERVTALHQVLDEKLGKITTGEIETEDSVGKSVTLVDGDSVGNSITRVHDDTGGSSGGVQRKDGLGSDVHGGGVEGLEHDLGHLLSVSLGVERGFRKKDGVLLGSNTQFIVEGMMPNFLHVVPVGDDTVLDGVLEGQDTTLGLGLITVNGGVNLDSDLET